MAGRAYSGQCPAVRSILHLQRTIGNQGVQRLLRANHEQPEASSASSTSSAVTHDFSRIPVFSPSPLLVQPELIVNTTGDKYEREADRVAGQVMDMPEPQLQIAYPCDSAYPTRKKVQDGSPPLQAKRVQANDHVDTPGPPIVQDVTGSCGHPLDQSTRTFMELRFGHDFSYVRVHTDAKAAESAQAVDALAYTVGRDIVFGAGQYTQGTRDGRRLLAHELTHVVQQSGTGQTRFQRQATASQPMIRFGSTGPDVIKLQERLNLLETRTMPIVVPVHPPIAVDGIFGSETWAAVRSFQANHACVPDGVVGPQTRIALHFVPCGPMRKAVFGALTEQMPFADHTVTAGTVGDVLFTNNNTAQANITMTIEIRDLYLYSNSLVASQTTEHWISGRTTEVIPVTPALHGHCAPLSWRIILNLNTGHLVPTYLEWALLSNYRTMDPPCCG